MNTLRSDSPLKLDACTIYWTSDSNNTTIFAGEYSIADIATWPWISRYEWQRIDLNLYPNVKRWYLQIASRPAVQKGLPRAKGRFRKSLCPNGPKDDPMINLFLIPDWPMPDCISLNQPHMLRDHLALKWDKRIEMFAS